MTTGADDPDVRCLDSRVIYENPWMTLSEDTVERRDGSTGLYGVMHARNFALVLPWDGARFHLVEQYRYPIGARRWEFPQGSVADERATSPAQIAAIELEEEAGLRAGVWHHLGFLHAGYGRSTNGFDVFVAEDLEQVPARREIEEQDMRSGAFTMDEVWRLVDEGQITDSHSVAALGLWDRWRRQTSDSRSPS